MNFLYGVVVVACLLGISDQSPVTKCKDGPLPIDVRIDGCTKSPCLLRRGTNTTAEWDFTVKETTKSLKPRVRATVMGATVSYPFPQKDACVSLKNATCPLEPGQEVTYKLSMPVLKSYPKIPLTIEFAFLGDNKKVIVCFKVAAKVVDK